jgi:hypothetical protein
MCRGWLKKKLKDDPTYALLYRVKRRIQARNRRKLQRMARSKS